jgi:hypothetical protein
VRWLRKKQWFAANRSQVRHTQSGMMRRAFHEKQKTPIIDSKVVGNTAAERRSFYNEGKIYQATLPKEI